MSLESYGLKARDNKIVLKNSFGRPKYLEGVGLITHLLKGEVKLDDLAGIIAELQEEAKANNENFENELYLRVQDTRIFDNFSATKRKNAEESIVFYQNGSDRYPVSKLDVFDSTIAYNTLNNYTPERLGEITKNLKPYINPKAPYEVCSEQVVDKCYKILDLKNKLPRIEIASEPHPIVVEGCEIPSLRIIPFTLKKSTLEDLNPYLRDFLERVNNHQDLCANIWTNFIGFKTPYVLYLQGPGEDGKSGFVKMLSDLVLGSVCNYDWSERFNYYNMYGKSLILMNECKVPHVLQHSVLKQITGGDLVQIEGKGKNAFTAEVRGQLIIVSNDDPVVHGTPDEFRRLRFYRVKRSSLTEDSRLKSDVYAEQLGQTPNAFLNYCQDCYTNLKTPFGLVRTPENQAEVMRGLRDPILQETFKQIKNALIKNEFEFGEGFNCEVIQIHPIIEKYIDKKDKFAFKNIEAVLFAECNVRRESGKYIGVRSNLFAGESR